MTGAGFIAFGPCFVCERSFSFNPDRVPSYDPSLDDPSKPAGKRPICSDCIVQVNEIRVKSGLDPWPVFEDSYAVYF
jgi:hypothetical protein